MRVVVVTAAVKPYSKGSASEFCASLPKMLRRAGHDVTILSPLYGNINLTKHALARRLTKLEFSLGGRDWACELYTGRSKNGANLVFIGNEEILHPAESLADPAGPLLAQRAGVFATAAAQYLRTISEPFDVVHAQGWVGGLVLGQLREGGTREALVFTVHDAHDQGHFEAKDAAWLPAVNTADDPNALRTGLLAADRITTLSSNYALRLQQDSDGLEAIFIGVGPKLSGIRNGIDPSTWNPLTDPHLPARYDAVDREGKAQCKAELQHRLVLPIQGDVPLIAAIGRSKGDGLERLAEIGPDLLRNDVQVVVQIKGGGELVAQFEELWDRWPDRIQIRTGSDEAFRHQLIAAADAVVVPGEAAPAEHIQMCAQRYGALPVVHRDGGLADEVVDCEPSLATGSGFLYDEHTAPALLSTLQRVVAAYANTKAYRAMQGRIMRIDHSWERAVRLYEAVYKHALSKEEAA